MTRLLTVSDLSREFSHDGVVTRAVDGVDLHVDRGDFVSVMGPSGCGKSTLLNLIGGLDLPTGGSIDLDGTRVDTLDETRRARLRQRRIGFVFQHFNLISDLSVRDNVELPALLVSRRTGEASARCDALLERLGLTERAGAFPRQLSGGERQRVALARALVNSPGLLLADEPTGSLDSVNTGVVLDLLSELHREGQTIVLVTHDTRVATAAQRLVTMRDGRLVHETLLEGIEAADRSELLELER
jgi:putative ABC transport system ATP-binding protein